MAQDHQIPTEPLLHIAGISVMARLERALQQATPILQQELTPLYSHRSDNDEATDTDTSDSNCDCRSKRVACSQYHHIKVFLVVSQEYYYSATAEVTVVDAMCVYQRSNRKRTLE